MTIIDFSEYSDHIETIGRSRFPKEGKAHLLVVDVEDNEESIDMVVTYEIVAHEVKEEVGKMVKDFFRRDGKASEKFMNFAVAIGLVTRQELIDNITRGAKIDIDVKSAYSKSVCNELIKSEYPRGSKKFRVKTGWEYYPTTATGFPRNEAYAAQALKDVEAKKKDLPF